MILNLHGLNGHHDNGNYRQLLLLFPEDEVYSPQIDYVAEEPEDLLDRLVMRGPYSLVVGNSLGGFFAYILGAVEGFPTVITNPCIPPHEYILGLEEDYQYQGDMKAIWNGTFPGEFRCSVILGDCDEVIDHAKTMKLLSPYHQIDVIHAGHSLSGAEYAASFQRACQKVLA